MAEAKRRRLREEEYLKQQRAEERRAMSVAARKPAPKPSRVGAKPSITWSVVQPASGTIAVKPIASAAAKNMPPWASAPPSLGLNARRCARSPIDHRVEGSRLWC